MYFEGYGNFFGIEASAYINITMSALEIYVWGKAWNLVYAELYISASYDVTDFKNAHFYVRVIVDMRKLTDVSSMFSTYLKLCHTIEGSPCNNILWFLLFRRIIMSNENEREFECTKNPWMQNAWKRA